MPIFLIFVAGLASEDWLLPWLKSFRDLLPTGVEIRVFGTNESVNAALRDLKMTPVGRLPDAGYWARFAASNIWVYPHEDPLHSHYVPLEAISLGIPCVLTARTAVAAESRASLTRDVDSYGIVHDRSELGALTARLLQSNRKRHEVAEHQRVLLRPFSTETVVDQARELVRIVTDVNASRHPASRPRIRWEDVGPPSATQLRSALASSIACPTTVSASSLAIMAHSAGASIASGV